MHMDIVTRMINNSNETTRSPAETRAKNKAKRRDKFICQWKGCGRKEGSDMQIHTHHLKPKERENPDSIITYCLEHHIQWHFERNEMNVVYLLRSQFNNNIS